MATRIKARGKRQTTIEAPSDGPTTTIPSPEAANENASDASSLGWNEAEAAALGDALKEAEAEAVAEDRAEPEHAGALPLDPGGYIARDVWPEVMGGFFHLASAVTQLRTLYIDKADPTYREAAFAVWDTCRETPYMDFLIRPGGKWMARAAAMASFGLPIYFGCKAELAARRARPVNDNAPSPANDNAAVPPEPSEWR